MKLPRRSSASQPLAGAAKSLHDAVTAHRQGRTDWAIELARRARKAGGKLTIDADVVIAEALYRAGRYSELRDHLASAGEFKSDRRWTLMSARAERAGGGDLQRAETLFQQLIKAGIKDPVHRMSAFELVKMYEKAGRHAEAWETAQAAHAFTTELYDLNATIGALERTAEAARKGDLARVRKASRPAHRTAFIFGMPRSGTTLIEQMLDCHTHVRGMGELNIHGQMETAIGLEGGGVWPQAAMNVGVGMLDLWQTAYRRETREFHQLASNIWTLDKSLFPGLTPIVFGPVFPGCKVIRVERDARDNAVSLFLNNLNTNVGWTASLESIQKMIRAHRVHTPVILDALGIETITVRLEALVESPETHARAMLKHLGLEWQEVCLHPDRNQRIVHTLSHEQVRRPINREGMGRWKKHSERFDTSWDELS
jgi:tetratricopeptide (TPR) repeat protein